MLMKIIVVGKPKDKTLGAKSAEFVSRCQAYGKVECVELPDSDVAKEGKALMRELEKEKNSFAESAMRPYEKLTDRPLKLWNQTCRRTIHCCCESCQLLPAVGRSADRYCQ